MKISKLLVISAIGIALGACNSFNDQITPRINHSTRVGLSADTLLPSMDVYVPINKETAKKKIKKRKTGDFTTPDQNPCTGTEYEAV